MGEEEEKNTNAISNEVLTAPQSYFNILDEQNKARTFNFDDKIGGSGY